MKEDLRSFTAMFIVECCKRLFCCNHTCYRVGMVSVTSSSRYQSRSLMYIRGLIPRNWPRQLRLDCHLNRHKAFFQ